jgi:hypothetical protein
MQKEGWQTAVTGASATVPSAGLGLDPPISLLALADEVIE